MKRFLLPLLAALSLPTAVNSEISDKIHNRCKDVKDYVGCVQMMGGQKKENEYGEGTRKFIKKKGSFTLFNPLTVQAMEVKGEFGRYLTYRYVHMFYYEPDDKYWKAVPTVEADCQDYTANRSKERYGYLFPRIGWQDVKTIDKSKKWTKRLPDETKSILDEFCPQMDRLVKEAKSGTKEYYIYQVPIAGGGNSSGGGTFKPKNQFDYKEFKQNEKIRNLENRIELDKINRERGY